MTSPTLGLDSLLGLLCILLFFWKVDDEAAAVLMAYFYEELKEGKSPTPALNRSQLKLRQSPKFHDPYFWSAFFLEGEYK